MKSPFHVHSQHRSGILGSALRSALTFRLLLARRRMVSTAPFSLALPEIRMTVCPEGRLPVSLHSPRPRSCCATASAKAPRWRQRRRTPHTGRRKRRDLSALIWASRLGSRDCLVLALLVLMCLPRETISTPEETRKSKKEGMDPRLQKRKEWKKLSFLNFSVEFCIVIHE